MALSEIHWFYIKECKVEPTDNPPYQHFEMTIKASICDQKAPHDVHTLMNYYDFELIATPKEKK